jgi:tetratricopeptide (TPR) repeat protein
MSEERYKVARLDEIEPKGSRRTWTQIRAHLGIQSFGVNAWTAGPGEELISEHDEDTSGQQELYFVLTGSATFTVDGAEVQAPAGTFVFAGDPATQRKAVASEPDTTVLALGAKPGEAYRVLGWEWTSEAFPLFGEERYAEAYDILARADEQHPDTPGVLYNLACAEARIGKHPEAVEHLRRAIELYDGFVQIARDDPDLEPIRDHPSLSLA